MEYTKQIAKHLRDVHFGGNWTCVNLKAVLDGVTWQQATTKVHSFNTIATLVFHINYYVEAILGVLHGRMLEAKDEYSFAHPPIASAADWQKMLDKTWNEAETLAAMIEQLPDSRLEEIFVQEKYGIYLRNLLGLVEHTHYHLGQITLIKKILNEEAQ
ncbi:hypothetical protein GCM10023093_21900 [Nemorincola caseinilytica]|uniref:DinB-like domain-containing protein n=1 Tax=Nemorincola caseinilytica TaxID=2054315 RepID=A0ABP8NGF9_9BACT